MKNIFKTTLFLFGLSVMIWFYALVWGRPFNIDHYFDRTLIKVMMEEPQLLSSIGIVDNTIFDFHSDDLSDVSDQRIQKLISEAHREIKMLNSYDYESLSNNQKLSYDIAQWIYSTAIEGEKYLYHSYPLNQLSGIQSELPSFMDAIHQVTNESSARNYISRLSQFDRVMNQTLLKVKKREELGIVPPRFVIEKVISQMTDFVGDTPEQNILFTSFENKLDAVDGLNPPTKHKLQTEVLDTIEKIVYPVYREIIKYLKNLESVSTTDDGVWKLPNGDAFYRYMLRLSTTSVMTPEEVHLLGLSEVERIEYEMRIILDSLGHMGGPVGEWMAKLAEEERFLYPNSDSGRTAIIKKYEEIILEIDNGLSSVFSLKPNSKVEVRRVPEFKEQSSAGAYYNQPSMDGNRPGVFYANLRNVKEIPSYGMRTLAYHEAIPGHHYQLALQLEMRNVPIFRHYSPFIAYIEGWALYAERVAAEYGFHRNPYSNLGRLQAELFRAVRLVVDTGIHYKKWTRKFAIDYMRNKTGIPLSDVVAEIERYIVWPGQACAYKIGMEKILEVREKARIKLGDHFDIRDFHTSVLRNGAVPLEIIDRLVDEYVGKVLSSEK